DLRAPVKGLPLVRASNRPFNFVLARVLPNLRNNEAVASAPESLGLVLPARIHQRVIYAETFAHGKTAFEIDPNVVAAEEMANVRTAVKDKLEESENSIMGESRKARPTFRTSRTN